MGPRSDREARVAHRDVKTNLVFELRLENLAGKHKSRRLLNRFHAGQIAWQPLLFFGKGSRFIRAHPLDLDAQRTLQLKKFGALLFHEERGSHAVAAVASRSPNAVDEI